jgi:hypothetical protein
MNVDQGRSGDVVAIGKRPRRVAVHDGESELANLALLLSRILHEPRIMVWDRLD